MLIHENAQHGAVSPLSTVSSSVPSTSGNGPSPLEKITFSGFGLSFPPTQDGDWGALLSLSPLSQTTSHPVRTLPFGTTSPLDPRVYLQQGKTDLELRSHFLALAVVLDLLTTDLEQHAERTDLLP